MNTGCSEGNGLGGEKQGDQLGGSWSDLDETWCGKNDLKVLHCIHFHTIIQHLPGYTTNWHSCKTFLLFW